MRGLFSKIENDMIVITLSKEIYEKEAVFAAAYKLTNLCYVLIEPAGENQVEVIFKPKDQETELRDLKEYAGQFCNALIDEQVQRDLERRYGKIRELVVQQAFFPLENLKDELEKK